MSQCMCSQSILENGSRVDYRTWEECRSIGSDDADDRSSERRGGSTVGYEKEIP